MTGSSPTLYHAYDHVSETARCIQRRTDFRAFSYTFFRCMDKFAIRQSSLPCPGSPMLSSWTRCYDVPNVLANLDIAIFSTRSPTVPCFCFNVSILHLLRVLH